MTVCIAASCKDNIVVCTDTRLGNFLGNTDLNTKEFYLNHGWYCLVAGEQSAYLALVRLYNERFMDKANVDASAIDASMKWPLYQRKRELADEYVRSAYAISYEEFLKNGKEWFPADQFAETLRRIKSITLGAELIVNGFIDGEPEIYYTSDDGMAKAASDFAVVGEGEYLASSVLLRRKQNSSTSLELTLYNVYEAKKFSEAVGSVGQKTYLRVLNKDGTWHLTSLELDKELESCYLEYGPKNVPKDLEFKSEYYFGSSKPDETTEA